MSRLARVVVRWWWAVILAWVGLAAVLHALAPPFSQVATYDNTAFLAEDAPAMVGGQLLAEGWPDDDFSRTAAIALVRPDAPLTEADLEHVRGLLAWLRSPDAPRHVGDVTTHLDDPALASAFLADDGQAMFVLVGFEVPAFTPPANETVEQLRQHVEESSPPAGLEVHVTGSVAVAADQAAAIDRSVNRTHMITIVLVLLILLGVYRSPVTPLVPLITIGVAFVVALATVSLLARAGMEVSSLYETFSIVIIFGAGTDYCIFLISRYHEELDLAGRRGYATSRPLRQGTMMASLLVLSAVLASSAATTIAGFSAQAVAEFGMFRTMGPAMALAVAITLAAALTLTPALMRLFGRHLFWPSRRVRGAHGSDELLIERHGERLRLPAYDRRGQQVRP